jgi:hypothetical protein
MLLAGIQEKGGKVMDLIAKLEGDGTETEFSVDVQIPDGYYCLQMYFNGLDTENTGNSVYTKLGAGTGIWGSGARIGLITTKNQNYITQSCSTLFAVSDGKYMPIAWPPENNGGNSAQGAQTAVCGKGASIPTASKFSLYSQGNKPIAAGLVACLYKL